MKKIFTSLFSLLASFGIIHADAGDTTIVRSHDDVQLSWYGDYDEAITFPDGSLSYNKILMNFKLGKYRCEGYDPNTAGEGPGTSGWCADWDYTVRIQAYNATDTFEIGRLITPYANSNYPRTPWTWKHDYVFDVTDYYPLLKDDMHIRVNYQGYSGGFTATIDFLFIEGQRSRDVVKIDHLWQKSYRYGNADRAIDEDIQVQTLTFPTDAVSAEHKLFITGHGNDGSGCAEFCSRWFQLKVNGDMIAEHDIWRDNCGSNFLYPQSGTWIWDRGNWCPGDLVHVIDQKLPATLTPGSTFTFDLDFQNHTGGEDNTSYIIGSSVVYYGDFNMESDAGIEAIISPNKEETYYRFNPICGQPEVKIKNYGSNTIHQIKFEYGIVGTESQIFEWNGVIEPLATIDILLASIESLNSVEGTQEFEVKILTVNEEADENVFNNLMITQFVGAAQWTSPISIHHKVTPVVSGFDNTNTWRVYDMSTGELVSERVCPPNNAQPILIDTLNLPIGCYKFEVVNNSGVIGTSYGLPAASRGYFKIFNLETGTTYPLPQYDLGHTALAGNYGNGFVQYFYVSRVSGIESHEIKTSLIQVYPNPASETLNLNFKGMLKGEAHVKMINSSGQTVLSRNISKQENVINIEHLANGTYTLVFINDGKQYTEKVTILK